MLLLLLNVCWSSREATFGPGRWTGPDTGPESQLDAGTNKEAPHVQPGSLFIVTSCFGWCPTSSKSQQKESLQHTANVPARSVVAELTAVLVPVRPASQDS